MVLQYFQVEEMGNKLNSIYSSRSNTLINFWNSSVFLSLKFLILKADSRHFFVRYCEMILIKFISCLLSAFWNNLLIRIMSLLIANEISSISSAWGPSRMILRSFSLLINSSRKSVHSTPFRDPPCILCMHLKYNFIVFSTRNSGSKRPSDDSEFWDCSELSFFLAHSLKYLILLISI